MTWLATPMTSGSLLLLAICALLSTGCTTERGWMRRDLSSRNDYLVPVPTHASVVVVSAPPGWHLDPEGMPVDQGSFVHPAHFLSPIVVSTGDDRAVVHRSTQPYVYARLMKEARREEPERLAFDRKVRAGFNSSIFKLPPPVSKDPESYRILETISLEDGRRVWLCRFHSPTQGYSLEANIPEDGFVVTIEQVLESSRPPKDLLAATEATIQSYRLRAATPRESSQWNNESPNIPRHPGLLN